MPDKPDMDKQIPGEEGGEPGGEDTGGNHDVTIPGGEPEPGQPENK